MLGVVALAVSGCTLSSFPVLDGEPIVLVVADVYTRLGGPPSVYVGGDAADDAQMVQARTALETRLSARIRMPSDRISGEPGASVTLGRFRRGADGRYRVTAGYVAEDGKARDCLEYSLQRDADGWSVAETTDIWPNCSIATEGTDSYNAVLARVRGDQCVGLWASVGTCGQWMYIGEGLGHGGTIRYFDWNTGLTVAEESCTDVDEGNGPCHFVFGNAGCSPQITETIPCE